MAKPATIGQLSRDEVQLLERTLASMPTGKTEASGPDADGLLKFGYHQNPYMRAFTKVLWSGYALSRGQLAEGSQRFSQARRDAGVSAIDQMTIQALEEAAAALEQAMSPDGTITSFLTVLRDKTMLRLWSRVCETTGLPPPRFHILFGQKPQVTVADLDAEEEAEMAALRKDSPAPTPAAIPDADDADDDDEDDSDEDDSDEDDEEFDNADTAQEAGDSVSVEPTQRPREERPARQRETQDRPARDQAQLSVTVSRSGNADLAPELVMSAASELLRELRVRHATGPLRLTLTVEGEQTGERPSAGGNRHRRRRR
jgi:hypothetical protein